MWRQPKEKRQTVCIISILQNVSKTKVIKKDIGREKGTFNFRKILTRLLKRSIDGFGKKSGLVSRVSCNFSEGNG